QRQVRAGGTARAAQVQLAKLGARALRRRGGPPQAASGHHLVAPMFLSHRPNAVTWARAGSEFLIGKLVIHESSSGSPYFAIACCEVAGACVRDTPLTAGPG